MKYLIFSDIHSNIEALDAMLALPAARRATRFLFLGDLVGYGPNPNDVIDRFRSLDVTHIVRGNHDKVVADLESSSLFNPVAAFSAEWSKIQVSEENQEYLKALPKGPLVIERFITLCHGSTFDEDYYVFSNFEAAESFKFMETAIGFFGHTHFPIMYLMRNERIQSVPLKDNCRIRLDANTRYLINPGSIGQPRDKNPDPSFVLFDARKREIEFIRFRYAFKETQEKIRGAGLPEILASRIESGI